MNKDIIESELQKSVRNLISVKEDRKNLMILQKQDTMKSFLEILKSLTKVGITMIDL